MKKIAVIVAGGTGTRMGADIPKQFLLLHEQPILHHAISAFTNAFTDIAIVVVLPAPYLSEGKKIAEQFNTHTVTCIEGGSTRFYSVKNGLTLVPPHSIVFVHDAVRCLLTKELIYACYNQALLKGSAIPAVVATDSIRVINGNSSRTADRNNIRLIQTPQTFRSELLLEAFSQVYQDIFTDEATVVEALGKEVFLIEGDYNNIKITRPLDLVLAEKILESKK